MPSIETEIDAQACNVSYLISEGPNKIYPTLTSAHIP